MAQGKRQEPHPSVFITYKAYIQFSSNRFCIVFSCYQGRSEILSLTGSFMQNDSVGIWSRGGGTSVCPHDQTVVSLEFGGGITCCLSCSGGFKFPNLVMVSTVREILCLAWTSITQVMVGKFIAGHEQSQLHLAKERSQRFGTQPFSISFIGMGVFTSNQSPNQKIDISSKLLYINIQTELKSLVLSGSDTTRIEFKFK